MTQEVVQRVRDGRALDTALARPPNKSLDAAAVAHIQVQLQDAQDGDSPGSNEAATPGTAVAAGAPSVVEEGQIVPVTPPPDQQ
mgnify:CR=1 FL=1